MMKVINTGVQVKNSQFVAQVTLAVTTIATSHPPTVAPGLWAWDLVDTIEGTSLKQYTEEPVLKLELSTGSYSVTANLEDVNGSVIGNMVSTTFAVHDPDVLIMTADSIVVEISQ